MHGGLLLVLFVLRGQNEKDAPATSRASLFITIGVWFIC